MIYTDFEHPSLENLPLRHAAFLNSLYHVGAGLSEVLTLVDYMQDPNLLDTAIPTSLATLAILSSEGQQRLSPEVQYG